MDYTLKAGEIFDKISQKVKDLVILNKMLKSNILLYFVLVILVVKIATIVVYLPVSQNFFFADITKIDLLNLLNQNRQSLGLGILAENEKLNEAARLKAQDMIKNDYFAHQSPRGVNPWFWFKEAGYIYKYAGENLAVGFADSSTVYDAWFNSPSHKENLLNKNYTEIGTAIETGFQGNSIVVVQLFASPLAKATPSSLTTTQIKVAPIKTEPSQPKPENKEAVPVNTNTNTELTIELENKAVQENTGLNVIPKVLSQSTEYIVGPEYAGKKSLYLQFLNFIVYDNSQILQYLSLGVLMLILACLIMNGILMFQAQNRVILVRPFLLIAILSVSIFVNKEMVSHFLPYQIII